MRDILRRNPEFEQSDFRLPAANRFRRRHICPGIGLTPSLTHLCQCLARGYRVCTGAGHARYRSDSSLCLCLRQQPPRPPSRPAVLETGVCFSGRPFPILGITVLGEVAAEPLHLANRSFLQLEWTPLYTGVASPLNARLLPIHQSRLPSLRLPSFSRRPFRAATTGSPFAAVYSLYEAS